MKFKKNLILLLGLSLILLGGSAAMAKSEYMSKIPAGYDQSCSTCHSSIPALNDLGKQFLANGYKFPEVKKTTAPVASTTAAKSTSTTPTGYTSKPAKVNVDGITVTVKGVFDNGTYYVPLADVIVGLGGKVSWDGFNKVVAAAYDDYRLKFYLKDGTMRLNDLRLVHKASRKPYVTDIKILGGRSYVPANSLLVDTFGFKYSSTKSEFVYTKMTLLDYLKTLINK